MAGFSDGLVQGDEAKKIYVARSKSVDEKTVTAANKNALTTKVLGEEQDGWSVAKTNLKSVRVPE